MTPEIVRLVLGELLVARRGWFAFALATGAHGARSKTRSSRTWRRRGRDARHEDEASDDVPITSIQQPWIEIAKKYAKKSGPAFGAWPNVLRGLKQPLAFRRCACRAGKRPDGRKRGTRDPNCDGRKRGTQDPNCERCRKTPLIAAVSPNDLRRSLGMWLRDAGVEPHLIGKVLRHIDSRMAERVYATGSKKGIAAQLAAQIAAGTPIRTRDSPKPVRHFVRHAVNPETPETTRDV